jgi:putative ABC transport system permease protein
MLGLNKRTQTFVVQRSINEYTKEPLLAIIPGSTLTDLWRTLGQFEKILLGVSILVLLSGLLSMLIMLLSTLNERRREMAILRAVGAHAYQVILLFFVETLLILVAGTLLSLGLLYSLLFILKPILLDQYGFSINIVWLDPEQMIIVLFIFIIGLLFSLIPGIIAYKNSLQDGLTLKF